MAVQSNDTRMQHGKKSKKGLWALLVILALIALAVAAFFVLGGDADIDADIDADAEIVPPDVNIEGGEAPDVDIDTGSTPDIDVQEGDAEANVEE